MCSTNACVDRCEMFTLRVLLLCGNWLWPSITYRISIPCLHVVVCVSCGWRMVHSLIISVSSSCFDGCCVIVFSRVRARAVIDRTSRCACDLLACASLSIVSIGGNTIIAHARPDIRAMNVRVATASNMMSTFFLVNVRCCC